ncbi:hypothetical protein LCGC14_0969370 [marine sediment metagenome]|uniref:Calcineurin-like phosphoesterase domain-containing protein n=1 Tax=marine sediment metagenome TaxID=412755 RepID=A0A0F9NY78_9ZZZZ
MKILHTSDLHLKEYEDERWKTLLELLEVGKKEKIEVFVISGDLFDKDVNAEYLRQHLRKNFSNNGFKIIILPGNHDSASYGTLESRLYFGSDVSVIYALNNPIELQDVRIWGFPFEPIGERLVLEKLHKIVDKLTPDKSNILLYHGELLDAFFSRNEFGEEGDERYMPIKLSYFRNLNFQYILAGHFHTRFEIWNIQNGGYFVYPGSPIPITKREKGRRKVNLFKIGSPPNELNLDSYYYMDIEIEVDPFKDYSLIRDIKNIFSELHPNAKVFLTVKGYLNSKIIGKGEHELVDEIKEIVSEKCVEENYLFEDINQLFEDDLFLKFINKLESSEFNEDQKKRMRELTIQAMRSVKY